MRDKVPQLCQQSSARAAVLRHRVLPSEEFFDMDVEGENPIVSVPKKSSIAPLTIAGTWVLCW